MFVIFSVHYYLFHLFIVFYLKCTLTILLQPPHIPPPTLSFYSQAAVILSFPPASSLHFHSISLCASHRITTYDILFYNNIFPLFITTRKIHKNVLSFRFIGRYVRVGVFYVYYTFYILGVKMGKIFLQSMAIVWRIYNAGYSCGTSNLHCKSFMRRDFKLWRNLW